MDDLPVRHNNKRSSRHTGVGHEAVAAGVRGPEIAHDVIGENPLQKLWPIAGGTPDIGVLVNQRPDGQPSDPPSTISATSALATTTEPLSGKLPLEAVVDPMHRASYNSVGIEKSQFLATWGRGSPTPSRLRARIFQFVDQRHDEGLGVLGKEIPAHVLA